MADRSFASRVSAKAMIPTLEKHIAQGRRNLLDHARHNFNPPAHFRGDAREVAERNLKGMEASLGRYQKIQGRQERAAAKDAARGPDDRPRRGRDRGMEPV